VRIRGRLAALLAAVLLLAAPGCGEDDGTEPPERRSETVDRLPELPAGWKRYINHRAGFAIGLAPGWKAERRGTSTLLRSPDHLVAVSISADRTPGALEHRLEPFARAAAKSLPGFKDLKTRKPRRFEQRYAGVAVPGKGRARKSGIRQRLLLIVLRRKGVATYPVLVARNAERNSRFYGHQAVEIVRTLRGRPIG
jgi:hypothetical protein